MTELLARMPDIRERVQTEHGADLHGRCRACGSDTPWPCEVSQIAYMADQLAASTPPAPRCDRDPLLATVRH